MATQLQTHALLARLEQLERREAQRRSRNRTIRWGLLLCAFGNLETQ